MNEAIWQALSTLYVSNGAFWSPLGAQKDFSYTDGEDVENRIGGIVAKATDVSLFSSELRRSQTDWPTRYHLSATRANLLRPLEPLLCGRTLEIGSGCGGITRFLGELGGEVVGIEGSPKRTSIAASRCRDLSNVTIVNDVFDDFGTDLKFDAVTMIGVFEYARIFGKGEDAAKEWLRKAFYRLNDGGHLIIAIENQLGLKYLAGMPEDHLAVAMYGVNDQYSGKTAVTYGRAELEDMLTKAGFGSVEVALPFPDYKLPTSVILPRGYDGSFPDFSAASFARQTVNSDAQLIHAPLFSLGQAWSVVARNGLLADLSNSLLLVARKGSVEPAAWATEGALALHYSTDRVSAFCKEVRFQPQARGIDVQKRLLSPDELTQSALPITLELISEQYSVGINHGDRFEQLVTRVGWQISDLVDWLRQWQNAFDDLLTRRAALPGRDVHHLVPGWTLDALPRNLMLPADSTGPTFIDLEWIWKAELEYGYVVYRALTVSLATVSAVAKPADPRHVFIDQVTLDLMCACGVPIERSDLERYLQLDGILRKLVFGGSESFSASEFSTFELKVLPDVTSLISNWSDYTRQQGQQVVALETELQQLSAQHATSADDLQLAIAGLRGENDDLVHGTQLLVAANMEAEVRLRQLARQQTDLQARLDDILSSTSWRISAPLRMFRRMKSQQNIRTAGAQVTKRVYRKLPISMETKMRIKGGIFRAFGPLVKNTRAYRAWNSSIANRGAGGNSVAEIVDGTVDSSLLAQASPFTSVREFVPICTTAFPHEKIDTRLIAFYLPQFHPIAENDAWWGRGFTEWTNVSKAEPQFPGHHQPQLPGELGFYDLRVVDVMRRQVELAMLYGVRGFCFHYYWFAGKRLLERPVDQYLATPSIDFPFCICWANENWTRRWDGLDGEILIGQNHSPEDDIAFIESLLPLLRDSRYIRVDGKPLIILYRPSLLPDASQTLLRWREHCRQSGIGEIFCAMVQFDVDDPRIYAFDAAIEFPPHKVARGLEPINAEIPGLRPDFNGMIFDYQTLVNRAAEHAKVVDYPMIRGVFPAWDNEARKPGRGYMFAYSSPDRYRKWLRSSIDYAEKHPVAGEKLVFVNAWNEWAEGAHLEPDQRYGYAYLQATRDALLNNVPRTEAQKRVVVVSHDAHPHGAQYLALHLVKELVTVFGFEVDIVLLGGGPLCEKFEALGHVTSLAGVDHRGTKARVLARMLALRSGFAIANTTVSGLFAETLSEAGVNVVSLVHELPGVIRGQELEAHAAAIARSSRKVVFPAKAVHDGFAQFASVDEQAGMIRAQGLFSRSPYRGMGDRSEPRARLRERIGASHDAKVVLAVGYGDKRKGLDIFVDAGIALLTSGLDLHMVWVGHLDTLIENDVKETIRVHGFADRFHFMGLDFDTDVYYVGADIYALTSREDPFPSVVLEALSVGTPVVAFASSGGAVDILQRGCGVLVDPMEPAAYATALLELLNNPQRGRQLGAVGEALVAGEYSFRSYVFELLNAVGLPQPKVTAIVPNFNYARHLSERMTSIDRQTVPVYELIVLDDHSTDDSLAVLDELRPTLRADFSLIKNDANSGSVFKQWLRGAELAQGDFLWIAEADDVADPDFLATALTPIIADGGVVLSFTQSQQIDEVGKELAGDYLAYTADVDNTRWRSSYVADGRDEVIRALSIKNTIPNVSAVIFNTSVLRSVLADRVDEIVSFGIAGDWVTYLHVLDQGKIAFDAAAKNRHRRHANSVTLGFSSMPHLLEVLRVQKIARECYALPPAQVERAWAYSSQLYQQFGLNTSSAPSLDQCSDAQAWRP